MVDLGCDFDVSKEADGRGHVSVCSGWVVYRIADQEMLVSAGFGVQFDARHVSTPIRPSADLASPVPIDLLERALADTGAASTDVAAKLRDAGALTAPSLLPRYPKPARTALYPRLAKALKVSDDDAPHRPASLVGNQGAIDARWQRIRTRPKKWWANWSDAFN